jgi:hypothetical protein
MTSLLTPARIGAALLAVTLGLAAANQAQAQARVGGVANTVWLGTETAPGFDLVAFGLEGDGTAFMYDVKRKALDPKTYVKGSWTQNGDTVQIRFRDCVYTGRITGDILAGSAQFTSGSRAGEVWTFSVRKQQLPR